MIGGAALMVLGSFLTWFTLSGEDVTGFSELGGETRDGPIFLVLGVILAAFGITTLLARRMLAIAIIAVVLAALSLIAAVADYGDVNDLEDFDQALGRDAFEVGPGLPIIVVGTLVALAGGIVALAKRRRRTP
jgi:hypothetical protein